MDTDYLVCIFYKGHFAIEQYSQWNGSPEVQGMKILRFLQTPANIERFKDGLKHTYIPDEEELRKIQDDINRLDDLHRKEPNVDSMPMALDGGALNRHWPSLSRSTGSGILEIVAQATAEKPVPVQLSLDFETESHSEWLYIVDLDRGMFRVYQRLERKDPPSRSRFLDFRVEESTVLTLIESFSIVELPTTQEEFITALNIAFFELKAEREQRRALAIRNTNFSSSPMKWVGDASACFKSSALGSLSTLPTEVRELVYEYAFSINPYSHGTAETGLGLLCSSIMIYKEAIPLLYRSQLFGIGSALEGDMFRYSYLKYDAMEFQCGWKIRYLSPNFYHLVQNLQVDFRDEDFKHDLKLHIKNLQRQILQLSSSLQKSTQLKRLDVTIKFLCNFKDINQMDSLIEPIKMLRGIQNPSITINGYQRGRKFEPRWELTEEYASYLEQLLMSPHCTTVASAVGIQVFEDLFESSQSADESINPSELADLTIDSEEETLIAEYLRDVYHTDDRTALQGGMPEGWQAWLHSICTRTGCNCSLEYLSSFTPEDGSLPRR